MEFTKPLTEFAGLPVVDFPADVGAPVPAPAAEVAWRIDYWEPDEAAEFSVFEDVFTRFVEHVDTTRLTALVFGCWGSAPFDAEHHPARALVAEAARFPALRSLFFGDIAEYDERPEIVYIDHIDLTPVLTAFPALEELWVRGTPKWVTGEPSRYFEPIRHASLRGLVVQSGGLNPSVIQTISECGFPELRHLELYLGHPDWMGDAKVSDLAWLLAGGTFPKLDRLGLRNSVIQDEIAAAVAHAPIVASLGVLDLSLGALGDDGARALLNGQPLQHLRALDLHHNYFSEAMRERLRTAWPGVDVDLSWHRTEDELGRRYVGIGA